MLVERRRPGHRPWWLRGLPGRWLRAGGRASRAPSPREIVLPVAAEPEVSVVVPAFGNAEATLRCLDSLARSRVEASFETVVVDDGSPSGSLDAVARVSGVTLQRSRRNRGFVAACNLGARRGRGSWIVFLNNDTQVTDGWLDRLLEIARGRPRAGAVGARLLFEDGRLQEAGGIVWSDGSAHNVGRGDDPQTPAYGYVRAVDYCSAACLLIRSSLFSELGGFDEAYAPAYYEDVDLAFRIRRAGLEVLYQPLAVVVHVEGATAGRDTSRGVKRFQVAHREVLARRWPEALAAQPRRGTDPWLAKDRGVIGRCLVLDESAPRPARDAGSQRMIHLLRALVELGWKVTFSASTPVDRGDERAAALGQAGVECLIRPFERSVASHLRRRGSAYDVVILSRPAVARRWLRRIRRRCPDAVVVYDTVDLRWRRLEGEERHGGGAWAASEGRRSRRRELALARRADRVVATSPVEAGLLRGEVDATPVHLVPTHYPVAGEVQGWERREGILFVGGFRHAPNRAAARWLLEEIVPLVRRELGPVPVWLAGEEPPEELAALSAVGTFLGPVDDLGPWLERARVSVAPLLWGAGLKGKVHQSLAAGLPCVATAVAAEGLGARPGEELLLAEDAVGLADAIVSVYRDRRRWEEISAAGRRLAEEAYGWGSFRDAVAAAVGPPPTGSDARSDRKASR